MQGVKRVVVDASVALKWFFPEEGSKAALNLQADILNDKISAYVPDIILYEIVNGLVRGANQREVSVTEAVEVIFHLMPWDVLGPSDYLLTNAALIAAQHPQLSVYDASYVALADAMSTTVITADRKLHKLIGSPLTRLL